MLFRTLPLRRVLVALTSGCLVLAMAAHVRAGEEEGFGLLFHNLSGAGPAPQPEPVPVVQPLLNYGSGAERYPAHRRRAWRQSTRREWLREPRAQIRPKQKVRYAALPRPEQVREKVEKPAPKPKLADNAALTLAKAGDPGAALLRDATLRRGDIVITAQGPRVFTGKGGDQHRVGDFEDAGRSSSLDRRTRKLLAAMVAPAGALLAEEARRSLAKLRRVPAGAPEASQVQAQLTEPVVRVVYPGAVLNAAGRAR
ncbi:conserved hypothetical protein [Methylobacterium sp. 4-46]|uniref:hypothetical protein n=1 Tax=unclassified Methylobacterium TaxID=2615210 RepID=UPI000152D1AE|nr:MULTISPECIES: hypothetical protein [Methylobacterium]ACA19867.1 conserved hypothetical protein [Methylobacterium sp. 4-46]WFT79050.1 hypothetical protein QA634_28025 [Methylobacterium nodulans]